MGNAEKDKITEIVLQRRQADIKIIQIPRGLSTKMTGVRICRTVINEQEAVYIIDVKQNTRASKTDLRVNS